MKRWKWKGNDIIRKSIKKGEYDVKKTCGKNYIELYRACFMLIEFERSKCEGTWDEIGTKLNVYPAGTKLNDNFA